MAQSDNSLTPHLVVAGAAAAIDFYKAAFGAEEEMRAPTPDGSKLMHAAISIRGNPVYLCDPMGPSAHDPQALGGSPVALHLQVPDVDALFAQAVAAGAEVTMPVADMFWGHRYGQVRDPFGHQWAIATHIRDVSPEEMTEAAKQFFGG